MAQNLVGSHRAADHLVKVLSRLVLAVNFRIVRIGLGGTHQKNRLPEWLTLARAVKHFGRGRRDVACGWDWAVELSPQRGYPTYPQSGQSEQFYTDLEKRPSQSDEERFAGPLPPSVLPCILRSRPRLSGYGRGSFFFHV